MRETLFDLSSENEMYEKEAEIVNESFIARDDTYNLATGGHGGQRGANNEIEGSKLSTLMKRLWADVSWVKWYYLRRLPRGKDKTKRKMYGGKPCGAVQYTHKTAHRLSDSTKQKIADAAK